MAFPDYSKAEDWGVRAGKASYRQGTDIDTIIVHVMVGSYEGSMRWANDSPDSSFHYGVAQDGRVGQAVDEDYAAWHAGNWGVNLRSVGIEHEDKGKWASPGWMTDKEFDASTKLAAYLCRKYDIPVARIIPHYQVASDGRACPGPHFPLQKYKDRVSQLLSGKEDSPAPKKWYRVKVPEQQAGAFRSRANADGLVKRLAELGVKATVE